MRDVRLINANSFKRFLQALCKSGAPYDDVIQLLDKEPTVYNPERVVEELEERSKEYNSGVRLHGKPEEMLTHEAIDIVKRGGVK